jgi:hypothetical protein
MRLLFSHLKNHQKVPHQLGVSHVEGDVTINNLLSLELVARLPISGMDKEFMNLV